MTGFAVTVPHGTFTGAERRQDIVLRPPTGADEAFLLDQGSARTNAERVTGLLSRCVSRFGGGEAPEEAVRALTVGDREALLLHLRAAAHGDSVACVLDCPDCVERMDVELRVSDVLVPSYPDARASYHATVGAGRTRYDVRFRLPSGADQEAAARTPSVEAGMRTLLERCVDEVRVHSRREPRVPDVVAAELPTLMAELDPQAEITVTLVCPACAAEISALLDASTLLFRELTGTTDRLYREVHAIALHYHWGEEEILALDTGKRRRYLELIADSLGEGT